jgi:DNA-binding PadR family transcriptional regulator
LKLLCDKRFLKAVNVDVEGRKVEVYRITDDGRSFLRSY